MGKKTERIEELETDLADAKAELTATKTVLRGVGDMMGVTLDAPLTMATVAPVILQFTDALRTARTLRASGSALVARKGASWDTFDEEVDEQIDRFAEQGLTTPRDSASTDTDRNTALTDINGLARELGVTPSESPLDTLQAVYAEVLRIKNAGADTHAPSTNKALAKGDTLAEAVAQGHAQNNELRDEVAQARLIVGRIAAVMQVPKWDKDGTEILERAQQYEQWKHGLKRRIVELRSTRPTGVPSLTSIVDMDRDPDPNVAIAEELQHHLARLMSSKEMADFVKALPGLKVSPTVLHPPYPFTFMATDIVAILAAMESRAEEARDAGLNARAESLASVFRNMSLSREACEMFPRVMNVVVLPIMARQRAAQVVPSDALPPAPDLT